MMAPILVVFGSTHKLKKKVRPPLKKLSGSAHVEVVCQDSDLNAKLLLFMCEM